MLSKPAFRILDSHAHMGPIWNFYLPYNDAEGMLTSMDLLGIEATLFSSNMAICADVEAGNRYTLTACQKHPGRFLGAFTVNPHYPELMEREIPAYFAHDCMVGLKIHPELSGDYPMTGDGYAFMFRYASEHRIPILSHTYYGGDRLEVFAKLAEQYPDAPLIIGHGALDLSVAKAIDLCNRYPNLYFDLCSPVSKRYGAMKLIDSRLDPDKALFGTDSPWNDPAVVVGSVLFSEASAEKKEKWMRTNFLRLYSRAAKVLRG